MRAALAGHPGFGSLKLGKNLSRWLRNDEPSESFHSFAEVGGLGPVLRVLLFAYDPDTVVQSKAFLRELTSLAFVQLFVDFVSWQVQITESRRPWVHLKPRVHAITPHPAMEHWRRDNGYGLGIFALFCHGKCLGRIFNGRGLTGPIVIGEFLWYTVVKHFP